MRKTIFLLFFLSSLIAYSQNNKVGLGIIVGEPTGLSAKIWTTDKNAFDASLAWTVTGHYDALHLHADFLKHSFGIIEVNKGRLPLYFGIGAKVVMANNPLIGLRIPLGASYIFSDAPLDIFLEVVPVLNLIPSTEFDVDPAAGIRYYF